MSKTQNAAGRLFRRAALAAVLLGAALPGLALEPLVLPPVSVARMQSSPPTKADLRFAKELVRHVLGPRDPEAYQISMFWEPTDNGLEVNRACELKMPDGRTTSAAATSYKTACAHAAMRMRRME